MACHREIDEFARRISRLAVGPASTLRSNNRPLKPAIVIGIGNYGRDVIRRMIELGQHEYTPPDMHQVVRYLLVHESFQENWPQINPPPAPETEPAEPAPADAASTDSTTEEEIEKPPPVPCPVLAIGEEIELEHPLEESHLRELFGHDFSDGSFPADPSAPRTRQWWDARFLGLIEHWMGAVRSAGAEVTNHSKLNFLFEKGHKRWALEDKVPVEVVVVCSLNELMSGSILLDLIVSVHHALPQRIVNVTLICALDSTATEHEAAGAVATLYEIARMSCLRRPLYPGDAGEFDPGEPWPGLSLYRRVLPTRELTPPANLISRLLMVKGPGEYSRSSREGEEPSSLTVGEFLFHLVYTDVFSPDSPVKFEPELQFSDFGMAKVEVPIAPIKKFFISRLAMDALQTIVETREEWHSFAKSIEETVRSEESTAHQKGIAPRDNDGSLRELLHDHRVVPEPPFDPHQEALALIEQALEAWLGAYRREITPLGENTAGGELVAADVPGSSANWFIRLIDEETESRTKRLINIGRLLEDQLALSRDRILRPPSKKEEIAAIDDFFKKLNQDEPAASPESAAPIDKAEIGTGKGTLKTPESMEESLTDVMQGFIRREVLKRFTGPIPKIARAREWIASLREVFELDKAPKPATEPAGSGVTSETAPSEEAVSVLDRLIAETVFAALASLEKQAEEEKKRAELRLKAYPNRKDVGWFWATVFGILTGVAMLISYAPLGPLVAILAALAGGSLAVWVVRRYRGQFGLPEGLANEAVRAIARLQIIRHYASLLEEFKRSFSRILDEELKACVKTLSNIESSLQASINALSHCAYDALERIDLEPNPYTRVQCYPAGADRDSPPNFLSGGEELEAGTLQAEYLRRVLPKEKVALLLQRYATVHGQNNKDVLEIFASSDKRLSGLYRTLLAGLLDELNFRAEFRGGWLERWASGTDTAVGPGGSELLWDKLISAALKLLDPTLFELDIDQAICRQCPTTESIENYFEALFHRARNRIPLSTVGTLIDQEAVLLFPSSLLPSGEIRISGMADKDHEPTDLLGLLLARLDREQFTDSSVKFIPCLSSHLLMLFIFRFGLPVRANAILSTLLSTIRQDHDFSGIEIFPWVDYSVEAGDISIPHYRDYYGLKGTKIAQDAGAKKLDWILIDGPGHSVSGAKEISIAAQHESRRGTHPISKAKELFQYLTTPAWAVASSIEEEPWLPTDTCAEDLTCLFMVLARHAGLKPRLVQVYRDESGRPVERLCASLCISEMSANERVDRDLLIDFSSGGFDIRHQQFEALSVVESKKIVNAWVRKVRKELKESGRYQISLLAPATI